MTDLDEDGRLDRLLATSAERHVPAPGLAARIAARRGSGIDEQPRWLDWLHRHPLGGIAWAALPLVLGFALGGLLPSDPVEVDLAWQDLPALAFSELDAEANDDE
jgi:hypothetical protein